MVNLGCVLFRFGPGTAVPGVTGRKLLTQAMDLRPQAANLFLQSAFVVSRGRSFPLY